MSDVVQLHSAWTVSLICYISCLVVVYLPLGLKGNATDVWGFCISGSRAAASTRLTISQISVLSPHLLIEYTSQKGLGLGIEKSCLHHCWQVASWEDLDHMRRASRLLEYWLRYSNEYSTPKIFDSGSPIGQPLSTNVTVSA